MYKPAVLCVDDEFLVLESLEIQIKKYLGNECLIETASGGEEALELFEELLADKYEVALVITDCIMPGMRGDELLRRMHEISPKTIKIMLTGQANAEAVGNAINYGNLYRYIAKPWQDEDLRLTVKEAIRLYLQDKKLEEQNAKLAEYNQNLEQLVESRTHELEERNRQLQASERKYRDIVETSQNMIWSVDIEGRYTFVNQAVKQIYGYEPEEMLGRPFADFMTPKQSAKDLEVFQSILAGETLFQYETTHIAKDGRPIHLLFNAIALRDDRGNVLGTTGTALDITKRKQAEEAMKASEKKYRALVEASQDVIWSVNREGRYTFVNQAVKQIYGYEPEEMLGRRFTDFQPPEQITKDLETFQHVLDGETVFQYESTQIAQDGRPIYLMINAIALLDDKGNVIGTTGTASDITKRKQREEALRLIVEGTASKTGDEFFRSCVRYLAQLLQVRYALVTKWPNQATTRLRTLAFWTGNDFGEDFEYDIANTPCHNLIEGTTCYYPENLQALFPNNPNLAALGAQSYFGIPLINGEGKILGHLAVMDTKPMVNAQDSTDIPAERLYILKIFAARATAELERKLAEDALKQSAYAADAANRAKSAFLSRMSHELRTPLNAILGFTQVMSHNPSLSLEAQEHLEIISRSGEHLLELINDILEMSKIESGRVTLNETSFDLYCLLDTLKHMFQIKAKFKGIELIFDRAPDVPQYLKTDESKLRGVLINLLGNAIKFTDSGRVTFRVSPVGGKKQLTGDNGQLTIQFEVEDTGPGIVPEEMHLLFTPFEQTETGRKSQQGTGLGLPLSQKFVQLMGGNITVSSTVGIGTIFKFDIPLCLAQSPEVKTSQETRRVMGLAPDQKNRILVVDDVKLSRLLLVKLLTSTGFEVREATNGLEAIALWESWKPHLILMDMLMPVMDGYEATRQIKAKEQGASRAGGEEQQEQQGEIFFSTAPAPHSQTIIIAVTANAFEEDRAIMLSAGCDDFVTKPFQKETILDKIARYLGVCYIYEEPVVMSSEKRPQKEESPSDRPLEVYLSQMPAEWVTQLYHEAASGSDNQIFQLIEQIPSTHAPLRHTLMNWVNEFRFEQVINLIQRVNNSEKDDCLNS